MIRVLTAESLGAALRAVGFTAARSRELACIQPAELLMNPDAHAATPREARRLHGVRELAGAYTAARTSGRVVHKPEAARDAVGDLLRNADAEHLVAVLLSTSGRVITIETISSGGLSSSIVDPRIVFRRAIAHNAASIVLAHNHPSGNPEPSREDIRITKQLVEAGKVMGIPVQDHVIVAGATFTSLAERGLM